MHLKHELLNAKFPEGCYASNEYVLHDVILLSEFHSNKILILCEVKRRHKVTRVWTLFFLLFRSKQIIFFFLTLSLSQHSVCVTYRIIASTIFLHFFLFNNLAPEREKERKKMYFKNTDTYPSYRKRIFNLRQNFMAHWESFDYAWAPAWIQFRFWYWKECERKMQNSCSMLNLLSPSIHLCVLYEWRKRKIGNPCTCKDFFSLHLTFFSPVLHEYISWREGVTFYITNWIHRRALKESIAFDLHFKLNSHSFMISKAHHPWIKK